jgi:hypothetical protein
VKPIKGKWWIALAALCCVTLVLFLVSNVSTSLTREDVNVFRSMGLAPPARPLTNQEQIELVRRVQRMVFERSPLNKGIAEGQTREPSDLLRLGHGLCFDRSRTMDKAFAYLGFQTRHVFLLYRQGKSFPQAMLSRGQWSHAVTEVKLSEGWVLVDSLTPWMAVTRDGQLVSADQVWQRHAEFDGEPTYMTWPWWAVRGMYSRGGGFYHSRRGVPEISYPDFLAWAAGLT